MLNDALFNQQSMIEKDFLELFQEIQNYISNHFSSLISEEETESTRIQVKNQIKKYLNDHMFTAKDMTREQTVEKIYNEMTEFSVLNQYLDPNRTDIEEININAWNDIKINYSNGTTEAVKEHFFNPQHCENIIRRLLNRESKMVLDKSRPIVRGHLSSKIRITVMGEGVIDQSIGLAASLRIVNPKKLNMADFIRNGTAIEEQILLLETLLRNGVSMCITGETNSGKTTLMSYLLTTIPYDKRVFTIEEDVREFNLIVADENGKVVNNVIHTRTKKSDDPNKVISQERLLETAMTMNPDVICVAEMKGKESFAAQEAANTGHTVITTTHANSCRATYSRMENLCRSSTNMDSNSLKEMLKDAFPVVVFIEKYPDKARRITEITEFVRESDGTGYINTLYEYEVSENQKDEDGNIHIKGSFVKRNNISTKLQKLLRKKGVQKELLDRLLEDAELAETEIKGTERREKGEGGSI